MSNLSKNKKITVFVILLIFVLFFTIWSRVTTVQKKVDAPQEIGEPGKEELTGELVEGFPVLSVYPNAALLNSYKKQEGEKVGFEANWEVNASVFEVMSWYIDSLSQSGWVFEEEPVVDESFEQYIIAERDGLKLFFSVEREESITVINAEIPFQ